MELYILSKQDLSILSICKLADYQINLDEETNAKSTFTLMKTDGLKKDNFMVLNGLYRQFLFIIDEVNTEKGSDAVTVTALDISNIFDRKVIEKNTDTMTSNSIEEFIANTMSENFVNSDDTALNVGYIDIYWHTNTQGTVSTNAENGLYNFHTFLINCRQYKNIYTDFKFENGRLRIDIENKQETTELIDTTLPEVTDYNKIYEADVTAKVQVYIREDGSEYNLYLKTDRTTTTNKDDPDRASGKIEVISVETADRAEEEALNVMKGNNYKHLVEFKIAKTSKLMDITELHIGRPIRIKTEDDIYDSYISALTLSDENFVYFKSGSLRITLLDKLKASNNSVGNKLDVTGGKILGNLNILDNAYFGRNGVSFGAPYDEKQGGLIQFLANKYLSAGGAINMNNSDIINANCIYMNDEAEGHEGINFLKQGASLGSTNQDDYENLRGYRGNLYYNENPIIDSGSNSNGTWIKWMDGTMICRKKMDFGEKAVSNPWGSLYESNSLTIGDYAQPFVEIPDISIMPTSTFFVEPAGNHSKTYFGSFWAVRPVNSPNFHPSVSCIAIGKWK